VKERLVRVTSEAELKVGAIYVLKACKKCGNDHRFMIISHIGERDWADGASSTWDTSGCCSQNPEHTWWTPVPNLREGRLFRVEDPNLDLDEENPYLVARPRERRKLTQKQVREIRAIRRERGR
jgi:hypothetical protein